MATAGTRDSRNFWPSVGIGLIAGLVIVLVIFRFTAPSDVVATTSGDDATNTSGEIVNSATAGAAAATVPTVSVTPTNPAVAVTTPVLTASATADGAAPPGEATQPTIQITKTVGACKAGPECLIASFAISGFPDQPSKFICEFQDGSQFSYSFKGNEVERACYTSTKPGSITIVVNTTRSETITNP